MLSLVLGLAFSVFSVFCFWLSSFAKKTEKRGRRFFSHETTGTFDDGTFSIHTRTHTHTNIIIIMVFTTVLSTVRVVASSVSRHSLSFSILPRFLSLSLSARANASRPCEQIIYSAFLSISEKMYYHTQAHTTTTTTANQSCLSRVRTADVLSLHEASARANGDYR